MTQYISSAHKIEPPCFTIAWGRPMGSLRTANPLAVVPVISAADSEAGRGGRGLCLACKRQGNAEGRSALRVLVEGECAALRFKQ